MKLKFLPIVFFLSVGFALASCNGAADTKTTEPAKTEEKNAVMKGDSLTQKNDSSNPRNDVKVIPIKPTVEEAAKTTPKKTGN